MRFAKTTPSFPSSSASKEKASAAQDSDDDEEFVSDEEAVEENISDEEILASVPTAIRDAVRETFETDFQVSRDNSEIFYTHTPEEEEEENGEGGGATE
ncbi:MAG: hypothetical protein LUD72_06575 [Bacteroidales bacterium]|nr:hypothetical protein [Bacteroidales bacterium]